MNLEQALAACEDHLASREVGDLRVIVDYHEGLLLLQIQRRSKKRHWMLEEDGNPVRYLEGLLQDGPGRYRCILPDLACLVRMRSYLPLRYQTLMLPECDDWHPLKRGEG